MAGGSSDNKTLSSFYGAKRLPGDGDFSNHLAQKCVCLCGDYLPLKDMPLDRISGQACRDLWNAVLHEVINIIVRPKLWDKPHEADQARAWIGGRDFQIVCALAGHDAEYIYDGFKRMLTSGGAA